MRVFLIWAQVLQSDPYFQLTGSPGFNHSAGLSLGRVGELVQVTWLAHSLDLQLMG